MQVNQNIKYVRRKADENLCVGSCFSEATVNSAAAPNNDLNLAYRSANSVLTSCTSQGTQESPERCAIEGKTGASGARGQIPALTTGQPLNLSGSISCSEKWR